MLILLSAAAIAAMQNGNDLYQQSLARETAGDIKGAIQIFERIVRDFSSNRTLTAKALLQLGRWSELLGRIRRRGITSGWSGSSPINRSRPILSPRQSRGSQPSCECRQAQQPG